jgi:nucleoside-triphosphate--adenylate kinase
MAKGGLVSDEIVLELLLHRAKGSSKSLLIDGFPRTVEQADLLAKNLNIAAVIALNIPHEVIIQRISNRWIHAPSGRTYAYDYNPPKVKGLDDVTQEPLVQRADDTPEAVKERLEKYDKVTSPLIDYYQKQGIVQVFSGTESDVIYPNVKKFFQK